MELLVVTWSGKSTNVKGITIKEILPKWVPKSSTGNGYQAHTRNISSACFTALALIFSPAKGPPQKFALLALHHFASKSYFHSWKNTHHPYYWAIYNDWEDIQVNMIRITIYRKQRTSQIDTEFCIRLKMTKSASHTHHLMHVNELFEQCSTLDLL